MRSLVPLLIALLVGLALVPAAAAGSAPAQQPASLTNTTPVETTGVPPATFSHQPPEDPENDTLGWENGYWYNESLPSVNPADGFNESELDKVVGRSMARVEEIRQLEFEKTVPVNLISRKTFKERYASGSNSSAEYRQFDNTKFEALFLINESTDSLAVQNENRGASVGGFYSPSEERIVLVSENTSSPKINEVTLSQELFHALQDQAFNLSSLDYSTRESHNANDGIVEGDGNYVDRLYSQRCAAEWDCLEDTANSSSSGGGLANIGVYFIKFQPYSDGPNFVAEIQQERGWEAVNDLYRNPPESSEQVINPDKYGEDSPTNVSFADKTTDDWQRISPPGRADYASVGQPGVASMFVYPLYHSEGQTQIVNPQTWLNYTSGNKLSETDPLNYNFPAAQGWDGDRMHIYSNADNETAYVWRISWDSPADVTEFLDAYRSVLDYWGAEQVGQNTYEIADGGFADAFHIITDGTTVTIVNAPSVEELSDVYGPVSVESQGTETATESDGDRTASPTATPGTVSGTMTETDSSGGSTTAPAPGFGAVVALAGLLIGLTGLLAFRRR